MNRPSILDVVRAVTEAAPAYTGVARWWYVPSELFRLGSGEVRPEDMPPLEVVVETADGASLDLEAMAVDLSRRMRLGRISVRRHRGVDEEPRLYRLLTVEG